MATATASTPSLSLLLVAILLLSASAAHGGGGSTRAELKEKLSHLHFFFHEVASGRNPTVVRISGPVAAGNSTSRFGSVSVMDDPLREGEDPASKLVGRAQGVYVGTDHGTFALLQAMNLVFTEGKYNGSALTVLGWNPALLKLREMPVVGGSGLFRFARGYAVLRTRSVASTGDAVAEYDVFVWHF